MSNWFTKERIGPSQESELSRYSAAMRQMLHNRGLKTAKEAEQYLHPSYDDDLNDPFLLKDLDRAIGRIKEAMSKKEKIVIFADYDCDGIPGASVLFQFFKRIGYENVEVYIPHRHKEGYSMNIKAVERLAEGGAKLIVTVDLGIANFKEVDRANELGVDVIITDHHLPLRDVQSERLPKAYAIVNPKREHCLYPYKMICGAAVAFKLVQGMLTDDRRDVPLGWEKWLLDLVGLATISDMVPLLDENRVLAKYGLLVMRRGRRLGTTALARKFGLDISEVTEEDLGYYMGPRINAASRMGEPMAAFELLSTDDHVRTAILTDYLEDKNKERKALVQRIMRQINADIDYSRPVSFLGNREWHPGVLGLAAGKISDSKDVVSFVWGMNEFSHVKGSCRSNGRVNMVDLMARAQEISRAKGREVFKEYGGHKEAGGFSMLEEMIDSAADILNEAYEGMEKTGGKVDINVAESELVLSDVNLGLCEDIDNLSPFGIGNPRPVFIFKGVTVLDYKLFGKNDVHLKLKIGDRSGSVSQTAIMFNFPERIAKLTTKNNNIDLVASVERDSYSGGVRLRMIDILADSLWG